MRHIIELNEIDIKDIIKEYYMKQDDTIIPPEVSLYHYENTEGYGMSEHSVTRIKAEVKF